MEAATPVLRRQDAALPFLFRIAAKTRAALPSSGTAWLYRSPLAKPLRRSLAGAAPRGLTLTKICGGRLAGAEMFIDLSCEKYYWLGTHEQAVQDALVRELRAGDVVYDVGAHAGFFSLLCARAAGPDGMVHAFEPVEGNAERLQANMAVNALGNVAVHTHALADIDGDVAFVSHPSTLEGRVAGPGETARQRVPTRTVDSLVREGLAPPSLIKIDVEGAEGRVLAGAIETLARHRPKVILEVHSEGAGDDVLRATAGLYKFTSLTSRREAPRLAPDHYLATPTVAG